MSAHQLESAIERLLFNRSMKNQLVGYSVETAREIMALIADYQEGDTPDD